MRALLAFVALTLTAYGQSVGGQVVNAATGRPVAGATVVLQGAGDSYVVETDSDGRFRAADVAPGAYEARAARDGFTALPRGVTSTARWYPRFTVQAGHSAEEIALRLIPLGAISGRVLDGDGDPAPKGRVMALGYSYAGGQKSLKEFGHATINDRGEFRVSGLPPGRYYLKFSPFPPMANFAMSSLRVLGPKPAYSYGATFYPASAEADRATPLDLAPGGELRDRNILVLPEQLYTVRVTLMTTQNGPSQPAVGVSSPNGMSFMLSAQYGVPRLFADSAPGDYLVTGQDRKLGLSAERWVKVLKGDVDVTLTLSPELALGGMVWAEGGGKVALDGVKVSLRGEGSYREAAVKADGTFSARVQPALYRIRVSVPAGAYLKAIRLGERELERPQVDLSGSSAAISIVLGTDGARLEGTTSEGAVVVAAPAGRLSEWTEQVRSATAARDGRFELRDLAPGDYRLLAFEDAEDGAPLDAEFRQPFEAQGIVVRVEANGRETVKLRTIRTTARR